MLKLRWVLCVLMGLTLAISASARAEGDEANAEKPAKAVNGLRGEYAIMAKQLKLTDDQKAKLIQAVNAAAGELQTATADWKKKSDAAKTALAEAKKKKDADAVKTAQATVKEVKSAKPTQASLTAEKLDTILTDDQKATWAGYKMYTGACRTYAKYTLTDEQKTQLRAACDPLAKNVLAAEDKTAAKADAKKKLDEAVMAMLTDEQKKPAPKKQVKTRKAKPAAGDE